jgi:hypothetical protein
MDMESHRGMILTGKTPKNSEKNLSQCHFSATNPTWTDPGADLGLRDERPTINGLSHGTAIFHHHQGSTKVGSVN